MEFRASSVLALAALLLAFVPGCSEWDDAAPRVLEFSVNGISVVPEAAADEPTLTVAPGASILGLCRADDHDNDPLAFTWVAASGITTDTARTAKGVFVGTAGTTEGTFELMCTVDDSRGGGVASQIAHIRVLNTGPNHTPTAVLAPASQKIAASGMQVFTCTAKDADTGDTLTYQFFAQRGTVEQATLDTTKANYTAPSTLGDDTVYCVVSDGKGAYALAVATVNVEGT